MRLLQPLQHVVHRFGLRPTLLLARLIQYFALADWPAKIGLLLDGLLIDHLLLVAHRDPE